MPFVPAWRLGNRQLLTVYTLLPLSTLRNTSLKLVYLISVFYKGIVVPFFTLSSSSPQFLSSRLDPTNMKLSTVLIPSALFLSANAQGQPCAAGVTLPCTCPKGTNYLESGTYVIAGVPSAAALDIAFDFFNTTWQKRPIVSTEGTTNTVGANRTIRVPTSVGTYDIKQTVSDPIKQLSLHNLLICLCQLTYFAIAPDGSFKSLYEQVGEVPYKNGKGKFAGWWEDLQGENAFPYETPMRWSLYACQTGHPIGKHYLHPTHSLYVC